MAILSCKVSLVEAMTDMIYKVHLIPNIPFSFKAGQYLMLVTNNLGKYPFSLASAPSQKKYIELHIYDSKLHFYTESILESILKDRLITVDVPYGNAWLREEGKRPIILIAGGIGFSYIRSILITALERKPDHEISIYWGVREPKQLYNQSELKALSKKHSNLKVILVVKQLSENSGGHRGTILSEVMKDFHNLTEHDIYIAGRFDIAKNIRKHFCNERGAKYTRIFGDAFSYN